MNEISDTLLKQRLRNRIIEVLETFSDQSYVEKLGTDEIIECWYDFVDDEKLSFYNEPIFTKNEINALNRFHYTLESLFKKVPSTWSIQDLLNNEPWSKLKSASTDELQIFMERGLLNEDEEIT